MTTSTSAAVERAAGPRTWRILIGGGALVATAFIVRSVLFDTRTTAERPGPYAIECFAPKGVVTRFSEFRGRGAKPAGGWFRFEVFDATKGKDAPAVLVGEHRLETVWTPAQTELLTLPPSVRWKLSAVGADGAVLDSKECEARRTP